MVRRARPIVRVASDPRTDARTRRLLWEVRRIKRYGEHVGLKATRNYEAYVALDRPAVVWVVSACRPLAFEPKTWRFPVVGSFTYLGWFGEADARTHAADLDEEGWDVYVRGAPAYSTVGWFRDPVLSTMLGRSPHAMGDLVNVVLHESVHATVYVPGQSPFNESVASFVADRLTLDYLAARWGPASDERSAYGTAERARAERVLRLHETYVRLQRLYASQAPSQDKLRDKHAILDALAAELSTERPINNAHLIQFRTYRTGEDAFARLLGRCRGDWGRFMAAVGQLGPADFGSDHRENLDSVLDALEPSCWSNSD